MFNPSMEATDVTRQTTAFRMALIMFALGAAAALHGASAVASEPAIVPSATTIQAGDEVGFAALAGIEAEPLSPADLDEVQGKATATGSWSGFWNWKWTGSQWTASWTWVWDKPSSGWVPSSARDAN